VNCGDAAITKNPQNAGVDKNVKVSKTRGNATWRLGFNEDDRRIGD
jgi:hypothetical protein